LASVGDGPVTDLLAALNAGGPDRNVSMTCQTTLEMFGLDMQALRQRLRACRPDVLAQELVSNP